MFYGVMGPNCVGLMDQQYVWCQKSKAYEQKNSISMVKHGGPIVFASVNLDCKQDIMDSLSYQAILANIVMPSVQRLKLDDQ